MANQVDIINAATRAARAQAKARIDAQAAKVRELLAALAQQIGDQVQRYAGPDGTVNAAQIPAINEYLSGRLRAFLQQYHGLIDDSLVAAAVVGSAILPLTAANASQNSLVQDVLQFVRDYRAADGLNLSDRIWRVSNQMADTVSQAIQNGIVRGQTPAQAAREYVAQGLPVPDELQAEIGAGSAANLGTIAADSLMNSDAGDTAYNLERVLRTEMNRAYSQSYINSALQHPEAAGVKFNLSPAHPREDICDLYASANLYGLGPGVYPDADSCPYPAHPNTLSFLTTVFNDQVTQDDVDGQETWQDWLDGQDSDVQDAVLGSQDKDAAFRAGNLQSGDLRRPWKAIAPGLSGATS